MGDMQRPRVWTTARESVFRVLLIEDDPEDAYLIRQALDEEGEGSFSLLRVERLDAAIGSVGRTGADVVVADLTLPDARGVEVPETLLSQFPHIPLVVLTGTRDEELGLLSIRLGAEDFISKGQMTPRGLCKALRYAIERRRKTAPDDAGGGLHGGGSAK
jgi:DNA-binding NarL/FixJ family response regulator